jgi:hypothetical protein
VNSSDKPSWLDPDASGISRAKEEAMFIATILRFALGLIPAASIQDEPAKTVVDEPIANLRVGRMLDFVEGVTASGAYLKLVDSSSTPIGIDVKPVDPSLKAHLKLDGGAVVARVVPQSEAAKAGINVYDVVLRVEGQTVPDVGWLQKRLENPTLGKKTGDGDGALYVTTIDLVREAKPLKVELRRIPKPQVALTSQAFVDFANVDLTLTGQAEDGRSNEKPTYRLGVSLAEADEVLRSQLKLADGQGLVVTQVIADGPAAKAGVAKNDLILTFDQAPTKGVEDLTARVQKVGDKPTSMVLQRAGEKVTIDVRPKKDDPVHFDTVVKDSATNDLAEIVSDFIILSDKDGKRFAVTGKPARALVTTSPQIAETFQVTADKTKPSIEVEIRELRRAVDRLQEDLARLEKERVVEKLQSTVSKLEAAISKGEESKK